MSDSLERTRGPSGRVTLARFCFFTLAFFALWAILAGGRGWSAGAPFVVLAAVTSCLVAPMSRWSLAGLARFLPYFLWNSLRGGVDVASRILHPKLPIKPGLVYYELQLSDTAARVMMANTVTLLPGTLSANLDNHVLVIHVLNADASFDDMLGSVERRVADLFALEDGAKTS